MQSSARRSWSGRFMWTNCSQETFETIPLLRPQEALLTEEGAEESASPHDVMLWWARARVVGGSPAAAGSPPAVSQHLRKRTGASSTDRRRAEASSAARAVWCSVSRYQSTLSTGSTRHRTLVLKASTSGQRSKWSSQWFSSDTGIRKLIHGGRGWRLSAKVNGPEETVRYFSGSVDVQQTLDLYVYSSFLLVSNTNEQAWSLSCVSRAPQARWACSWTRPHVRPPLAADRGFPLTSGQWDEEVPSSSTLRSAWSFIWLRWQ